MDFRFAFAHGDTVCSSSSIHHSPYFFDRDGDGEKLAPDDIDGDGGSFIPTGSGMGELYPTGNSPLTSLIHMYSTGFLTPRRADRERGLRLLVVMVDRWRGLGRDAHRGPGRRSDWMVQGIFGGHKKQTWHGSEVVQACGNQWAQCWNMCVLGP
jgi:hypothetical protein